MRNAQLEGRLHLHQFGAVTANPSSHTTTFDAGFGSNGLEVQRSIDVQRMKLWSIQSSVYT